MGQHASSFTCLPSADRMFTGQGKGRRKDSRVKLENDEAIKIVECVWGVEKDNVI